MHDESIKWDDTKGYHREGDLTFDEMVRFADSKIRQGFKIWIKFTCQNCHARQTSDTPNVINRGGYTCEECGQLSHPKAYGCQALGGLGSII